MVFQCINIRQVPWEVLKTTALFDPNTDNTDTTYEITDTHT